MSQPDAPTLTAEERAQEIVKRHWGWRDAKPEADIAAAMRTYADARVKEEREACARIAETCWIVAGYPPQIRAMIAAAIRARQPAPGKGGGT